MSQSTDDANRVALTGLDGSNPLAFLAALGTLRTVDRAHPEASAKLSWSSSGGTWVPTLHCEQALDREQLLTMLSKALTTDATQHPISFMDDEHSDEDSDPHAAAKMFRTRAEAATGPTDHDGLNWLSAMSSDLAPDATSQLQTARRDYFWGNLKSVMKLCNDDHLRRTLFQPWDYADPLENQSLHIEPSEDRRHAHQWSKPSGDPDRKKRGGMLGANRLAIEAFPFFQSIAIGDKLATRGFSGNRKDDTRWTWPLWDHPISTDIVASVLALSALQAESVDHKPLAARGVKAVFRCRRILVGKTPNFTPAMAV